MFCEPHILLGSYQDPEEGNVEKEIEPIDNIAGCYCLCLKTYRGNVVVVVVVVVRNW